MGGLFSTLGFLFISARNVATLLVRVDISHEKTQIDDHNFGRFQQVSAGFGRFPTLKTKLLEGALRYKMSGWVVFQITFVILNITVASD